MIEHILLFLTVLTLAVIFHEMGHWFYFYHYHNKSVSFYIDWQETKIKYLKIPAIEVGNDNDYRVLSSKDRMNLYVTGILVGFFPILFAAAFVSVWYVFLIVLYVHGCNSDMDALFKIIKKRHNELLEEMKH